MEHCSMVDEKFVERGSLTRYQNTRRMLIHWIPRAHTWMNSTIRHCVHHDVAQRVRKRIINFRGKPNVRVSVPTCTRLEDNKKCRVRRRANCAHLLFASLDAFALSRIRILARAKTLSQRGQDVDSPTSRLLDLHYARSPAG